MPLWQDIYRHRDAVRDVGDAVGRLTAMAEELGSLELLVEAVKLAGAYERLANPRKRKPAVDASSSADHQQKPAVTPNRSDSAC
jgi:hypothetical protein